MTSNVNLPRRPYLPAASSGRLLGGHEISEKDNESPSSGCTTPSSCDESESSRSSVNATMHTSSAFLAPYQVSMQQTTPQAYLALDHWGCHPQLNNEFFGYMPMQALSSPESVNMGQLGAQIYTVQPQSYGCNIMMPQGDGPTQVPMSNNLPLVQNRSDLKNYAPPSGIQGVNSNFYATSNGISTDAYAMRVSPLPSYVSPPGYLNPPGNINSPMVMYPVANGPNIWVPSSQITHTMPPFTLYPPSSNNTPMTNLNNQNLNTNTLPNSEMCNSTAAPLSTRQKKRATTAANVFDSSSIQGTQSAAQTSTDQTPTNNSDEQLKNGDEPKGRSEEGDDVWIGECNYEECQQESDSNLFITWHGSYVELVTKLNHLQLDPKSIQRTRDKNIYNVVFKTHTIARKAFSIQKQIRVRMVPPRYSRRNWLRNPSPRFVVKFETKSRLIVRNGKSTCHDIVGSFLMWNFKDRKGCFIWADQLKGNRIRVIGCEGRFMFPDDTIKVIKKPPSKGTKPIGWVSYRNKHTKEDFVSRLSGNTLRDYIYWE